MNKRDVYTELFNLALISTAGFIVVMDIFKPGILIIFDHPIHFVEMNFLAGDFIPLRRWIDGWCLKAPLGQPMLLYTYQLGGWAVAFLNLILRIDLNVSYKLLVYLSYIITPLALYVFMRRKFGPTAGIVSAFLFMFQKVHTDLLLGSVWNSYLAAGIFVIFFDLLERYYREMDIRKTAILSIVQALAILAHPIAHQVSFLLVAVFLLFCGRRNLSYLVSIPVIGSLIAFFHIYNLLATATWIIGIVRPWLKGPLTADLLIMAKAVFGGFENHMAARPGMISSAYLKGLFVTFFGNIPELLRSALGAAGVIIFLGTGNRQDKKFLLQSLIFMACIFFVFSGVWHHIPLLKDFPLIRTMINKRVLVYIHIALCVFAAYAVNAVFGRLRISKARARALAAGGVILLLAVIASERYIIDTKGLASTTETSSRFKEIRELWGWLGSNLKTDSRIVYQSTFENEMDDKVLRQSHVTALAMYYTPFMSITTCGVGAHYPTYDMTETSRGMLFGKPLNSITDAEVAGSMETFNAGYIVTVEPGMEERISRIPGFRRIKRLGSLSVFERSGQKPGWLSFGKGMAGRYETLLFKDSRLKFKIENPVYDNPVTVKMAYHPFWELRINALASPLGKTPQGLMKVTLPGPGTFVVELNYRSRKTVPALISLLTMASALLCCFLPALDIRRIGRNPVHFYD